MTQKELNKEKKETSAEKEHYYSVIKYFEACTDKCKDKTVIPLPAFRLSKTFWIHFQGRSLARGSGEKYEDCLGFV